MTPYYQDGSVTLYHGDCREILPGLRSDEAQTCVTSPPYWGLRDYGHPNQTGLEATPEEFVATLVDVFREVRRVLREDGTFWLNLGDSYARAAEKGQHKPGDSGKQDYIITNGGGRAANMMNLKSETQGSSDGKVGLADRAPFRAGSSRADGVLDGRSIRNRDGVPPVVGMKPKDLIGIPWRVAFALQSDGWWLRSDIIWAKPNPMPESVTDRPTKAHEYLFLLAKAERYYYDSEAIAEPLAPSSIERLSQPSLNEQIGSTRAHAGDKTNGNMKAVGKKTGGNFSRDYAEAQLSHGGMALERPVYSTRNRRSVWEIATQPYPEAHFATFPEALIKPPILAGSASGTIVLDPFAGAGTTLLVAKELGRRAIGIEIEERYCEIAAKRLSQEVLPLEFR